MLRFLTGPVEGKWATLLPAEGSDAADKNREVAFLEQSNSYDSGVEFTSSVSENGQRSRLDVQERRRWSAGPNRS